MRERRQGSSEPSTQHGRLYGTIDLSPSVLRVCSSHPFSRTIHLLAQEATKMKSFSRGLAPRSLARQSVDERGGGIHNPRSGDRGYEELHHAAKFQA